MPIKSSPLYSKRCIFRRMGPEDYDLMRTLETDPDVVLFTSLRNPQSEDETRARLKRTLELPEKHEPLGIWVVLSIEDNSLVGWAMLLRRDRELPELGYMLASNKWRQGYGTEIAGRIVEYGFNELKVPGIVALTDLDNFGSIRVLEKLNFKLTEVITQFDKVWGKDIELNVFERIKPT